MLRLSPFELDLIICSQILAQREKQRKRLTRLVHLAEKLKGQVIEGLTPEESDKLRQDEIERLRRLIHARRGHYEICEKKRELARSLGYPF